MEAMAKKQTAASSCSRNYRRARKKDLNIQYEEKKMNNLIKFLLISVAAFFGLVTQSQAEYPEKPITMVIPLGPGGSHDLNARVFTSIVPQYLGNAIIVKLVPGASGQTGTSMVAQAKPDGYTLLFTHNYFDQLQSHIKKLPYNPLKDFKAVARINYSAACMIVRSDSKYKTLQDLFDAAKASNGKIKMGHSGMWGATMVPLAQILSWANVNASLTPYKGGGPTMQALLAGDVEAILQFPSGVNAQGNKVRTLACGAKEKSLGNPPVLSDLGFPGQIYMDRIILAPAGTPNDRIAKLQSALVKLKDDKTFKNLMKRLGENTAYMNGPDYEKVRVENSEKYKDLVKKMTKG
jgi:tripartite-type tricarboxylate transporter receptor subunit TctC